MTLLNRWFPLASLICAVLASLLLMPGLHGGFIFDDTANIISNPAIQMGALDASGLRAVFYGLQPGGITRILPTLSFAFDYWRGGGLHPEVFKSTNIAIHAVTILVLAGFFRALLLASGQSRTRAGIAALGLTAAWAMHPLQVSSVLYVVQRMQTMCTLFVVLALWTYLKARQAQIADRPSRRAWLLTVLFWMMALACKEDAVLLPAYTLALEVTVLRFRAADPGLSHRLRKSYLFTTSAGAALFLLVIVPHYWSWNDYPGRDFSSWERLLTQARLLCMYLLEIVLPLPQHMPFYYDWIQTSHGLLQPWTTLPAVILILTLLVVAWRLRTRRPLFALGVFLFFAGHFITSNVVNLELGFEHRNHFPMIGALLAAGDLLALLAQHTHTPRKMGIAVCTLLLMLLGTATMVRARSWDSPLNLARTSIELAPNSSRAWNSLALYYYELGGGRSAGKNNPYLDKAIDACDKGATVAPYSAACMSNLILFKTIKGNVTPADWDRYIERLQRVNMGAENGMALQVLMYNASKGVSFDDDGIVEAISVIAQRKQLTTVEYATIGYFILLDTHQPDKAYPYLESAVQMEPENDAFTKELIDNVKKSNRKEWAEKLEALARSKDKLTPAPQFSGH